MKCKMKLLIHSQTSTVQEPTFQHHYSYYHVIWIFTIYIVPTWSTMVKFCFRQAKNDWTSLYHVTLCISQLHPITVYRTVFGVCVVLVLNIIMCSFYSLLDRGLLHHDSFDYFGDLYVYSFYFELPYLDFLYQVVLVLQMLTFLDVSTLGHSLWILDWTCYLRTPLYHV